MSLWSKRPNTSKLPSAYRFPKSSVARKAHECTLARSMTLIAPGFIRTEMTDVLDPKVVAGWEQNIPLKRAGETEDVANACVFLASDLSAYINGQVLSVCGGML